MHAPIVALRLLHARVRTSLGREFRADLDPKLHHRRSHRDKLQPECTSSTDLDDGPCCYRKQARPDRHIAPSSSSRASPTRREPVAIKYRTRVKLAISTLPPRRATDARARSHPTSSTQYTADNRACKYGPSPYRGLQVLRSLLEENSRQGFRNLTSNLKALGPDGNILGAREYAGRTVGMHSIGEHTAIELIGADRPGLLSEIFAVLANLHCNVIAAEVWTHNTRVACVVYVNDETSCGAVDDPNRLLAMENQLRNVMRGSGNDVRGARTSFSMSYTHVDRRLHQLMFADNDCESDGETEGNTSMPFKPVIVIDRCEDKGYSVVNIRCKDRSKLLFDIVCTLTDMQFVVFHASISSDGPYAVQELYIRRGDGCTLESKDEIERVVRCLEAAILRRVTEGFSLELCGRDRVGLLSDVTRVLREHGLSVTRADVTTVGEQAMSVFYVADASGSSPVDMKTIEALRREIGHTLMLNVKRVPSCASQDPKPRVEAKAGFSFGSFIGRFLS